MKKIIAVFIVASLIFGSVSSAFATPTDVAGKPSETAVNTLSGFEIINGYPDGTFKPEGIVTRAEMGKMLIVALGLDKQASGTSAFQDASGHWAENYIAYAASLGIILGYPDGNFKPDGTVTYDEAITMIVRTLGYTDSALSGTWPANYNSKATTLNLLKDIEKASGGANRGDVAIMIYNVLEIQIGSTNSSGTWTANNNGKDTILLRQGREAREAAIITGEEDSLINLRPYVGKYAAYFVNTNEDITGIGEVKSTTLKGEWDGSTLTVGDIEYKLASSVEYVDSSKGAAKFENGVQDGFTKTIDNGDVTLEVKVSGKTINAVYSILYWDAKDGFLYEKSMLGTKEINGYQFTLEDNEIDKNSFELLGVTALADIKADYVVYVYTKNGNKDITRIAVGTKTVADTVKTVSSKGYKIGDTTYKLSALSSDTPVLAEKGTAYLDYFGDIFKWDASAASSGNVGVVAGVEVSSISGKVQIFNTSGSSKVYNTDSKTKLYAADGKTTETLNSSLVGEVVALELSGDTISKITKLYESDLNKNNDIIISKAGSTMKDNSKTMSLDSSAVFFITDGDEYTVAKVSDLKDSTIDSGMFSALYQRNSSDTKVVYGVLDEEGFPIKTFDYAVINEVNEAAVNGERAYELKGLKDGSAYTKETKNQSLTIRAELGLYELGLKDGLVVKASKLSAEYSGTVTNVNTSSRTITLSGNGDVPCETTSNLSVYKYDGSEYVNMATMNSIKTGDKIYAYMTDEDSDLVDVIIIEE